MICQKRRSRDRSHADPRARLAEGQAEHGEHGEDQPFDRSPPVWPAPSSALASAGQGPILGAMLPLNDHFMPGDSIRHVGLIVERGAISVAANVYPVRQFSRAGFDCGTLNDGASDLALSVLHTLLPPIPPALERAHDDADDLTYRQLEADPSLWSKWLDRASCRISLLAWKLHAHFAADVVSRMDREGGHVSAPDLRHWLAAWSPIAR